MNVKHFWVSRWRRPHSLPESAADNVRHSSRWNRQTKACRAAPDQKHRMDKNWIMAPYTIGACGIVTALYKLVYCVCSSRLFGGLLSRRCPLRYDCEISYRVSYRGDSLRDEQFSMLNPMRNQSQKIFKQCLTVLKTDR